MFRTPSLYVFQPNRCSSTNSAPEKDGVERASKRCSKNAKFLWSSPWWSLWSSPKHAINIDKKSKAKWKIQTLPSLTSVKAIYFMQL
jgi:hypothetical protein